MLTRFGIVTEVNGDRAKVRGQRPGCCQEGAGCSCGAWGQTTTEKEVLAVNRANAAPGDIVELAISGTGFLKAAAAVYLLPAVLIVAAAMVGHLLGSAAGMGDPASIIGGFIGLGLGAAGSSRLNKRAERTGSSIPVVVRVLAPQPATRRTEPVSARPS